MALVKLRKSFKRISSILWLYSEGWEHMFKPFSYKNVSLEPKWKVRDYGKAVLGVVSYKCKEKQKVYKNFMMTFSFYKGGRSGKQIY